MSSAPVASSPSVLAAVRSVAPIGVIMYRKRLTELIPVDLQMKIYGGLFIAKLLMLALMTFLIKTKNDQTAVYEVVTDSSTGVKTRKKTTAAEYDRAQISKDLFGTIMGALFAVGLYKWKEMPPIMQLVSLPLDMLDNKLFHIYALGFSATGSHARPFPSSDLMSLLGINKDAIEDRIIAAEDKKDKKEKKKEKKEKKEKGSKAGGSSKKEEGEKDGNSDKDAAGAEKEKEASEGVEDEGKKDQ